MREPVSHWRHSVTRSHASRALRKSISFLARPDCYLVQTLFQRPNLARNDALKCVALSAARLIKAPHDSRCLQAILHLQGSSLSSRTIDRTNDRNYDYEIG